MGETVWPRVGAVEVLEGRLNRDLGKGLRGGKKPSGQVHMSENAGLLPIVNTNLQSYE